MLTNKEQLYMCGFINDNSTGTTVNILNEDAQMTIANAVLDKMFEFTIGKYNKIDFSDIERSRGDVTKTRFYNNLNESIETLMDIHETNYSIPGIITISTALNNLKTLKNTFEYNFRVKNNCAIMIYNVIYYSIMEATSIIIANSISIAKDSGEVSIYTMNNKDSVLLSSLDKFNKLIDDGSILKFIEKSREELQTVQNESVGAVSTIFNFLSNGKVKDIAKKATIIAVASAAILYLASNIIPLLRELVYWIFKARHKISEAAQIQAEFLRLNIVRLQEEGENEKIISRQTKYLRIFESIAKKFSIDSDKTDRDTKIDIKNDKVDVSNVII